MLSLLVYLTPLAGILGLFSSSRMLDSLRDEPAGDSEAQTARRERRRALQVQLGAQARTAAMAATIAVIASAMLIGIASAFTLAVGAACATLIGMRAAFIAHDAAARTGEAARTRGIHAASAVALRGASVSTRSVAATSLISLGALFWLFGDPSGAPAMASFALGAGIAAFVSQLHRGLGAQPGAVADADPSSHAGDATLVFETLCAAVVAAIVLASVTSPADLFALGNSHSEPLVVQAQLMMFPLVMALLGMLASVAGQAAVGTTASTTAEGLPVSECVGAGVFVVAAFFLTALCGISSRVWLALVAGLFGALITGLLLRRAHPFVSTSTAGGRLADGALPLLAIAACLACAYELAGAYGLAVSSVGMLSTSGVMVVGTSRAIALDARGLQNGSGPASAGVAGASAMLEGACIASAAATAMALSMAYELSVNLARIRNDAAPVRMLLHDADVILGLLVGASVPLLASGFVSPAMTARGAALPLAGALLVPMVMGVAVGPSAVAGVVMGGMVVGVALAMRRLGPAPSGRGAVSFDGTAGPVRHDVAPSMSVLIKLMSIVAIVLAPLLA